MATTTLSFDAVPSVLADIVQKLEVMEQKLDALHLLSEKETGDTWLSLKDLCNYLPNHPSEQTVYSWTSTRFIPYHKQDKRITFLKSEIDEWLRNGKRKSAADLAHDAQEFVSSKKKPRF